MDIHKIIKAVSKETGTSMAKMSEGAGMSYQSFNRSINTGAISLERFVGAIKAAGWEIHILQGDKPIVIIGRK